jgi:hypothetical protein
MSTIAVNAITDASGGNTASINGATPTTDNLMGRNRIINGAMEIDQRNAGAAVTSGYPVDRFQISNTSDGTFSAQQDSSAPAGFTKSLKVTITSADSSLTTTQRLVIVQQIEGYNVADFGFGAADAQTVTLSFWVRSSLTGTFGGSLLNGGSNRSYPFTYSISAADTWEYKTITVAGDTTGTWATDNSSGMRVYIGLGAGPDVSGTAGAWAGADYASATGATSVVGTNGATFYITGVQLEAGSVATSFERRHYGQELALCQRYFEKFGDGCPLSLQTSTSYQLSARFLVEKRATPTFLHVTNYGVVCAGNAQTITSLLSTNTATTKGCVLNVVPNNFIGVTAGQAAYVSSSIDGLSASSEL